MSMLSRRTRGRTGRAFVLLSDEIVDVFSIMRCCVCYPPRVMKVLHLGHCLDNSDIYTRIAQVKHLHVTVVETHLRQDWTGLFSSRELPHAMSHQCGWICTGKVIQSTNSWLKEHGADCQRSPGAALGHVGPSNQHREVCQAGYGQP